MHSSCRREYSHREYTLDEIGQFHGHIGPSVVMGYRIGQYVRDHFCDDPFAIHACFFRPTGSPEICMADGIQLACGCTLGKGNIEVIDSDEIRFEFRSGVRRLIIKPLSFEKPPRDERYMEMLREIAERIYESPPEELFLVSPP